MGKARYPEIGVINMALSLNELEMLRETVNQAVEERKKSKKRASDGKKKNPSQAQRRIPKRYTRQQKRELEYFYKQVDETIQHSSHITPSRGGKRTTKQDLKKGTNNNLGIHGFISESYQKDVRKRTRQFVKWAHMNHGVKHLRDLKPRMIKEFIETKMENGEWTSKTMSHYISAFKKLAECNAALGIISHKNLLDGKYAEFLKEKYKYNKNDRVRGKKKNGMGLSLREAKIIRKHAGRIGGPLGQAAVSLLIDAAPRISEFMRIKWSHIDFEKHEILLAEKNMTKNGRPRVAPLSQKTASHLKDIWDCGIFKNPNQTVFGSHFRTQDNLREFIRQSARSGKVAYLGVHAFRNATKELELNKLNEEAKMMTKKEFKEQVCKRIMHYVSANPKLNPLVKRLVPKRGHDGMPVKNKKGGYVRIPDLDNRGHPIMEPRYTFDKLMDNRIEHLKYLLISQKLGHNRTDVVAEY